VPRLPLPDLENVPATTMLREMFDRADIGMALTEISTRRFLRVNAKLCEITGYSEEELLNTTAIELTHPEDRAADAISFEGYVRQETDRRVIEKRHIRRDGTVIWVHTTTTIVQLGDVRCSFGITEDVTERRAAAAALEAAERRKNHFLATLAHELRNPLAAIRNSSTLLRGLPCEDPKFAQIRGVIERQSHNLERLVNDLLDTARITAGKITLDRNYVGIADAVGEAIETVQHQFGVNRHELSLTLPAEDISVYGDKLRLVQIFGNLLANAIKYTPSGGRVELRATADEHAITVTVTDTGIGIPPERMPYIFNLFEQAEETPAGMNAGLGIGLAITKRLVELHGGKIYVRSQAGVGSTFTVCLPRADRRIQRTERQPVAPRSQARILVIEDNADVAETMALVLRERGHEIRIAPDGASALAMVREEWLPHILLIDLGLPDIHGHELVKQLRTTEATAGAYMVAVSGYGQSSDIRASLEAGFDKHLVKPVDFDVLNAVLDSDRRRN
jgi:PAS domain S-box-containing protein